MTELHRMFMDALAQSGLADVGEDEIWEVVQRELILVGLLHCSTT